MSGAPLGRLVVLLLACAGCTPPAVAPPPAPKAPIEAPRDFSATEATFVSKRFSLRLPLPDGAGWTVDDSAGPWLVASHPQASSTLLVRAWREGDNTTAALCEARARGWRALPETTGADVEVIERRDVLLFGSIETRVTTAIVPAAPPLPLRGVVTAFGGWARRCFAYAFATESAAVERERVVGARLAAMVERSLLEMREESALSPSLSREFSPRN